ncbi:MAG: strictosidine synthase [Candidatus Hydrogenedentota bacterium]
MKTATRIFYVFLGLVLLAATYLGFWPVVVEPVAWSPPQAPPLAGEFAANDYLNQVERIAPGIGRGPEDVARDGSGRLYTGLEDGRIIRMDTSGEDQELFADTGGRPLGLDWDGSGNLIVADAHKGLLSIDPLGAITVLATEEGGVPFAFTDDVAVAKDGVIYFTDASHKYTAPNYMEDLLEHAGNGRLLAYDPATKTCTAIMSDLRFANGVTLSSDESYLLMNETGRYRIWRYWLQGERKGESELIIENLPGFPDNLSTGQNGVYWVALASPRDTTLDALLPYPALRKVLYRLPRAFLPKPQPYGIALGIDGEGNVIHNMQTPTGAYAPITSVNEYDGYLYLGSIESDAVGKVPVPHV